MLAAAQMFPRAAEMHPSQGKENDGRAMFCPRKTLAVALAALLAVPAAALPPQQPQRPAQAQEDPRARIRATVELVVVPVTVKDAQGQLVGDLRQNEFRVLADGIEQKIAVFSVDPFPLSAVVLIDNALKVKTAEQVQDTLRAIAAGFSDQDEVALLRFDTAVEQLGDFTADNEKLLNLLKRIELNNTFPGQGSGPMTAGPRINAIPVPGTPTTGQKQIAGKDVKYIDDAIYAAAQLLRNRERGRRKIIYLISDGINARNNTNKYDDTLRLLLSADISVYAIGVGDAVLNRGLTVLSRYAHATGGDVYYAASRSDLEDLYSQLTEQARNQYTLAFTPEKVDRSLEYHSIEVRVRRPNLSLLARDGYYAVPNP
jgi:VWFA-related protein